MTTEQKIARRKLNLLDLASDLGNVSRACKVLGYSRHNSTRSAATSRPTAPMGWSTGCLARAARIPIGWLPRSSRPSSTTPWCSPVTARCGWHRS